MKSLFYVCLLALIFTSSSTTAQALTLYDTASHSQYLQQGETYLGTFDINAMLGGDEYNAPYDISSASFRFYLSDDNDMVEVKTLTSDYVRTFHFESSYSDYSQSWYHRNGTWDSTSESEKALVSVNDQSLEGATAYHEYSYVYENQDSVVNSPGHTDKYFTNYAKTVSGYNGSFCLSDNLSDMSLLDLSLDGILNYSVTATEGGLRLEQAYLFFEVNENPLSAAPVPEPSTMFLLGSGLAGLAFYRRKRK